MTNLLNKTEEQLIVHIAKLIDESVAYNEAYDKSFTKRMKEKEKYMQGHAGHRNI